MRLRNVKNAKEIVNNSEYIIKNPEEYKGRFNKLFNNDNDIHLEIGMGKGDFLINMAIKYPNTNFIGIEKYESILVRVVVKLKDLNLNNIKIICMDASNIVDIFAKEIDVLYLNFSDPWPKKRHAKRRLTSNIFLNYYEYIFKNKNTIIQKTDNVSLFEYSLISYTNNGYKIEDISLDLHKRTDIDNVETEYEKKFSKEGIKINYVKVVK